MPPAPRIKGSKFEYPTGQLITKSSPPTTVPSVQQLVAGICDTRERIIYGDTLPLAAPVDTSGNVSDLSSATIYVYNTAVIVIALTIQLEVLPAEWSWFVLECVCVCVCSCGERTTDLRVL